MAGECDRDTDTAIIERVKFVDIQSNILEEVQKMSPGTLISDTLRKSRTRNKSLVTGPVLVCLGTNN